MKPIFETKKINGSWCVFYVNEKGGMWFAEVNGNPYGSYREFKVDKDCDGYIDILERNANDTINLINSK